MRTLRRYLPLHERFGDNNSRAVLRTNPLAFAVLMIAVLFGGASCGRKTSDEPPAPSADVRVDLESGSAVGFKAESGAKTWLGLPYAAPPVGYLRWRAPQPVESWNEERVAVNHPAWCPQITTSLDELEDIEKGQILGNEDCLYLSVYTPSNAGLRSNLPIMFWVHGGSNVWGRAAQYDGSVLAEKYGVVVMVAQYRLGPLGFFYHDALLDGDNGDLDGAANFAVLDLIEALKWVQVNGAAFGGNTDNVTLFGESAGAQNIYALMVSPLSEGLFKRAIAQSGNPRSTPLKWAVEGRPGMDNSFNSVVEEMTGESDPTAEQLRALSAKEVLQTYLSGVDRENISTMLNDGVTIPVDGIRANLTSAIQARGLPIILGSNEEEAKYLLAFNPELTKKRFGLVIVPKDRDFYDATSEYLSGAWRALTVNDPASELAMAGVEDVFTYRFDWDGQGKYWFSDVSYLIGSSHMVEIPFVFGTFDNFLGAFGEMMFSKKNDTQRQRLSDDMMTYWVNFAREGEPGKGISGVGWPSLTPETATATLVLDAEGGQGVVVETDGTTINDILSAVRTDPRLAADERRCMVAESLEGIFGLMDDAFSALRKDVCAAN